MKVREPTKSLRPITQKIVSSVLFWIFFSIFLTFDQFFKMSIYFFNAGCSSYGSNDSLENYDPSLHRKLDHPTSNIDTMIHLLKGNIGTGNLSVFLISTNFSAFSRCFHSIFVFRYSRYARCFQKCWIICRFVWHNAHGNHLYPLHAYASWMLAWVVPQTASTVNELSWSVL